MGDEGREVLEWSPRLVRWAEKEGCEAIVMSDAALASCLKMAQTMLRLFAPEAQSDAHSDSDSEADLPADCPEESCFSEEETEFAVAMRDL